ncbi:MAG: putative rane protein [Anaerocolumna sp.]|jgi:predicted permease|nr:putative rane protein [Anaerocolumna sp.]
MSLANLALNQILIMFLIIIAGIICFKYHIIDKIVNKKLSEFLLQIVNPLLIFNSYQREFSKELLDGLLVSFLLAIITHLVAIFVSYAFLRGKNKDDITLERFSVIYTNCGFMGIPLINGIIGSEGVFYITAYLTVFNLLIWSQGVIMMTGKQSPKAMAKTLISPTIVATLLGILAFATQIRVPYIVFQSFEYIANMNTPLAMIIAGVTIAQTDIWKSFFKLRIYFVVLLRLLLIPLVLLFIYTRFDISSNVITAAILAAGCPAAATGTLFALRYNKNSLYASEIFGITTLASLVSIPILMAITGILVNN